MTQFKNAKDEIEWLEGEAVFGFSGWSQERLAKLAGNLLKTVKSRNELALGLLEGQVPPADIAEKLKAMLRGELTDEERDELVRAHVKT